jgi:HAD superfamily hydrolase (TIGR01549 family)
MCPRLRAPLRGQRRRPLTAVHRPPPNQDGTLTVPCIDFADMRRRVAAVRPFEGDILHAIHSWPLAERKAAEAAIAEVEARALADMRVMPGAPELAALLDAARVPRALVTRNVTSSVEFFHRTHFTLPPFAPALTREFLPYKPHPAALHHIAEHWGVPCSELAMVGDSAPDDVVCGNRAGALTVLLDTEGRYESVNDLHGEARPHFLCRSLHEVAQLLHAPHAVRLLPPDAAAASAAAGGDA